MDNETKEMLQLILSEVTSIKQGQEELKQDVSSLKQDVQKINFKLENDVEPKLQLVYENQVNIIENNKQLDGFKNNLENINTDVFALKIAVKQLQLTQ